MTHLEIGGSIGGTPVTLCGTKNAKNPLKFYQEGDSPWKTWDGTFINGPTCTKCYFKREFMLSGGFGYYNGHPFNPWGN